MDILTIIRQKSATQPDQLAFASTEPDGNLTFRELMVRADQVAHLHRGAELLGLLAHVFDEVDPARVSER